MLQLKHEFPDAFYFSCIILLHIAPTSRLLSLSMAILRGYPDGRGSLLTPDPLPAVFFSASSTQAPLFDRLDLNFIVNRSNGTAQCCEGATSAVESLATRAGTRMPLQAASCYC